MKDQIIKMVSSFLLKYFNYTQSIPMILLWFFMILFTGVATGWLLFIVFMLDPVPIANFIAGIVGDFSYSGTLGTAFFLELWVVIAFIITIISEVIRVVFHWEFKMHFWRKVKISIIIIVACYAYMITISLLMGDADIRSMVLILVLFFIFTVIATIYSFVVNSLVQFMLGFVNQIDTEPS